MLPLALSSVSSLGRASSLALYRGHGSLASCIAFPGRRTRSGDVRNQARTLRRVGSRGIFRRGTVPSSAFAVRVPGGGNPVIADPRIATMVAHLETAKAQPCMKPTECVQVLYIHHLG